MHFLLRTLFKHTKIFSLHQLLCEKHITIVIFIESSIKRRILGGKIVKKK